MLILHTIAAFRAPTSYDILATLLVGHDQPGMTEAGLDRALADLEDRGLLGWDRRGNRYDLHPVVRGVVWSGLDSNARRGNNLQLATYFESVPAVDENSVTSVDDLAVPIELFHTLVRLGRYEAALNLMTDRIADPLTELGAFRQLAELAASVISDPLWLESIDDESDPVEIGALASFLTGVGYCFAGDPGRAVQAYDVALSGIVSLVERDKEGEELLAIFRSLRAFALCQLGNLAEAEREAWQGITALIDDDYAELAIVVLGSILVRRGLIEDGRAWLTDYRGFFEPDYFSFLRVLEFGWLALDEHNYSAVEDSSA
ncbi:MAG: hypothetical protein JO115_17885 [Pseudonocardiales bacterium]|nr:hypothetical protein [Pseudonocardiales bacterium]